MADMYASPRFTLRVVEAMRKHFPEELADKAWDNVGLLLGNITHTTAIEPDAKLPIVLLTNDLTFQVAEEAISEKASVIVSYHPFIFSGLKSITTNDPQQKTLLYLASHGIAVYCPHTALDAAPNGINTWLGEIVSDSQEAVRTVIHPLAKAPANFEGSGYGLRVDLPEKAPIKDLIKRVASRVGLKHVMVASPAPKELDQQTYSSVAVCAGSGWDVVKGSDADVIVTGEITHHNALRAVQLGKHVITVFHSNSERGYLREVLQPLLQAELRKADEYADVVVSKADRDPFQIVDVSEL